MEARIHYDGENDKVFDHEVSKVLFDPNRKMVVVTDGTSTAVFNFEIVAGFEVEFGKKTKVKKDADGSMLWEEEA